MRTNIRPTTHEGAKAIVTDVTALLRRSVLSCLLWEKEFYEEGEAIADRIGALVPLVDADAVYRLAIEAREVMHLRHVPLWLARHMARVHSHRTLVADALERVIKRPDELTEFLALYWRDGRQPLSAQVKRGLARAFVKFDAYQLAKWNRDGVVRLRDVMFLVHPKPRDVQQAETWQQLASDTLPVPDTWEVALSRGADKKATWERLLSERRLGGMALLMNLRNMLTVGVDRALIENSLKNISGRLLPHQFITASRHAPTFEEALEVGMFKCLADEPRLPGKTVLLVDVSGSMDRNLSVKSTTKGHDVAAGLAILARELCEHVRVFTFSNRLVEVPPRRGFALRDAILQSQEWRGTYLGAAVAGVSDYDRLIVITDEQSHDTVPAPVGRGYMINVASNQYGIGYGPWVHIDGWSAGVLRYIYHESS